MVRNYKRKKDKQVDENSLAAAVKDVLRKKKSIRGTAAEYGINHNTLFKRVKSVRNLNPTVESERDSGNDSEDESSYANPMKYKQRQVFSTYEEEELKKYLLRSSRINYGLTYMQTRSFAYEYAEKLGKTYPDTWKVNGMAGKDWMYGYMKRHPELSLRKPENTSLARASAFNETNVLEFFNNYVHVVARFKFDASKVYNLDETGITTVIQAPKVIAEKSRKQVGQIVSAERGELVTFTAIINAAGNSLPPVFIFPRVRYKDHFLNDGPSGSLGIASKTGWMTVELFPQVLKHIQFHTNCSKENPILLLIDNHNSHCSLAAIEFARNSGIVLLSFPPHCSHKLQPLDIGVFGPFKSALKVAFNDFMLTHPGKLITIYEIPQLAKNAYERAFTIRNIASSFQKPGIWPINRLAFTDVDFAAAFVTDRPLTEDLERDPIDPSEKAIESSNYNLQNPSTSSQANVHLITPEQIKPYPKAAPRKKKLNGRQRGKSRIFTDTPEKNIIASLIQTKNEKRINKIKRAKPKASERLYETSESEISLEKLPESDDGSIVSQEDTNHPSLLVDNDVLNKDDFVLVRFDQIKGTYVYYIGQIQNSFGTTDFDVKFLRKQNQYYVFPILDDVSQISRSEIISKLPEPNNIPGTLRTRGYYRFDIDFTEYNIR